LIETEAAIPLPTSPAASLPGRRRSASPGLRLQLPFLALVAAYALTGAVLGRVLHLPRLMRHLWYPYSYTLYAAVALCAVPLIVAVVRWRTRDSERRWIDGRPGWAAAWRECRRNFFNVSRLAEVGALILAVPLLMNALGGWKSVIPRLNPFSWDITFHQWDVTLHGGRMPWELLQPLLGNPAVTKALDSAYYAWFILAISMVVWQAWNPDHTLRARFFLSFALAWIVLGTGLATLLSSAGPCYFAEVAGLPSPYAPLMDYLYRTNGEHRLVALWGQAVLWADYLGGVDNPFNGISAMPSLHVAMPVLFALAGWRLHRWVGIFFAAYALVTLVGSVHLGWHYAVDGYLSIAAIPVIWWASSWLVDRSERRVAA